MNNQELQDLRNLERETGLDIEKMIRYSIRKMLRTFSQDEHMLGWVIDEFEKFRETPKEER